jgi:23S rRNA pseudouridine1911/1915/1917 synthase
VSDEGDRLDVVLARTLGVSRARAAARIDAGAVTVDGAVARRSHRVVAGERIEVAPVEDATVHDAPPLPPIRYRDEHLVVVAKPTGLVVHPGAGHEAGTLVDALLGAGVPLAPAGGEGRPGIVHRLDRDTTGLLVVACTDPVHAALVEALRERTVVRRYLALVDGVPAAATGRIEAPIGRDPAHRRRFATVPEGKPATTRYRTLASGEIDGRVVSLLACQLATGRTHQIRVHLTAIGHPVLGDPVYGPRPRVAAALGLTRPALHAGRLAFVHPVTGRTLDLTEPLPQDLEVALGRAGIAVPDVAAVLGDSPTST